MGLHLERATFSVIGLERVVVINNWDKTLERLPIWIHTLSSVFVLKIYWRSKSNHEEFWGGFKQFESFEVFHMTLIAVERITSKLCKTTMQRLVWLKENGVKFYNNRSNYETILAAHSKQSFYNYNSQGYWWTR